MNLKLVVMGPSKRHSFFLPSKFRVSFRSATWITNVTIWRYFSWFAVWIDTVFGQQVWSQQSKIKLEAIVINRSVSNMAGGQLQGVIKCQENHFHISGNVDIIASRSSIWTKKVIPKHQWLEFVKNIFGCMILSTVCFCNLIQSITFEFFVRFIFFLQFLF